MDELDGWMLAARPPEDPAAVAGARARFERLRREALGGGRRTRRRAVLSVTAAALTGGVFAGASVAAAANGVGPAPVARVLTATGVLPEPGVPSAPAPASDLIPATLGPSPAGQVMLVRYGMRRDDGSVPLVVFALPEDVVALHVVSLSGEVTELTPVAGPGPRVFLGELSVTELDRGTDDRFLVAVGAHGEELLRRSLSEAEAAYANALKAAVDQPGSGS